jgi:hypothetical protein
MNFLTTFDQFMWTYRNVYVIAHCLAACTYIHILPEEDLSEEEAHARPSCLHLYIYTCIHTYIQQYIHTYTYYQRNIFLKRKHMRDALVFKLLNVLFHIRVAYIQKPIHLQYMCVCV